MFKEGDNLISKGIAFHSFGAAAVKDLSPQDFNLILGVTRRDMLLDLKERQGLYGKMRSLRY